MGASEFMNFEKGNSMREAFNTAVTEAAYEHGHGGYTGTIAEKSEYTLIGLAADRKEAKAMALKLLEEGDKRVDNKWGPAGAIEIGDFGYLFFGWASE